MGHTRFRRIIVVGIGCLMCLWLLQVQQVPAADGRADATVRLVIDYGDGVEKHFTQIRWRPEQTVLDLLLQAQKHPHGVTFKHRGSGGTAFVYQIDDVKNEGQGLNWVFSINGDLADRSCGICPVKAGDRILWKFGKYE
jgi:hypothetical protein